MPRAARRPLLACACSLVVLGGVASSARAIVSDATVLDGPSADIVSLGGVAMAPDGTGGVVYLKRIAGRTHVFAARFVAGSWTAPQQVDVGQQFDSSWPVIGAGDNGRLVVVWVQEFGADVQDRMFSASLDPGATRFQAPIPIDLNVGDGTDIWPSLAMNAGGQALLVYHVILARDLTDEGIPPGYVQDDLRMQRYDGAFWSSIGGPIARNPSQPVNVPTAGDAPRVGISDDGNGVVAWQEPDDAFVDRIWARRIFSNGTIGNQIEATPATIDNKPLNAGVESFALAQRGFGTSAVAWLQPPSSGGPWTRPRLMLNQLPSAFADQAGAFEGARVIDGDPGQGPAGTLGPPSVAVDTQGDFDVGMSLDDQTFDVDGDEQSVSPPARLDQGSSIPGDVVLDRADDGALAAAWELQTGGADGVALLEQRADGTPNTSIVSSPSGGDLDGLALAGSGLGDAAIAFLQGDGPTMTLMGADIDAPPATFTVDSPVGWTNARTVPLSWDDADNAFSKVTYSVEVDDQEVVSGLDGTAYTLKQSAIPNGKHVISVIATDGADQPTTGQSSTLEIDRRAPTASMRRRGLTLSLKLSDGAKGSSSGVSAASTTVTFGDGSHARHHASFRHRYRRPGHYRIRIVTRDNAGNRATIKRTVVIR